MLIATHTMTPEEILRFAFPHGLSSTVADPDLDVAGDPRESYLQLDGSDPHLPNPNPPKPNGTTNS